MRRLQLAAVTIRQHRPGSLMKPGHGSPGSGIGLTGRGRPGFG